MNSSILDQFFFLLKTELFIQFLFGVLTSLELFYSAPLKPSNFEFIAQESHILHKHKISVHDQHLTYESQIANPIYIAWQKHVRKSTKKV